MRVKLSLAPVLSSVKWLTIDLKTCLFNSYICNSWHHSNWISIYLSLLTIIQVYSKAPWGPLEGPNWDARKLFGARARRAVLIGLNGRHIWYLVWSIYCKSINPSDFTDPLTFSVAPPWDWNVWFEWIVSTTILISITLYWVPTSQFYHANMLNLNGERGTWLFVSTAIVCLPMLATFSYFVPWMYNDNWKQCERQSPVHPILLSGAWSPKTSTSACENTHISPFCVAHRACMLTSSLAHS